MFGYVRPNKSQLRICDYERYRAAYCGLCRSLGKNYGFFYRFFVNYDMTFLYFLLSSNAAECTCGKCLCPANIFRKKQCYPANAVFNQVAALDIILCHWQIQDAVQDGSVFRRLPYRLLLLITKRGYHKAAKAYPAFAELTELQLASLSALEKAQCASIDKTADAFATILKGCAADLESADIRRPTEQVLYHVGRFLYLVDALDDLQKDSRSGNYNPLLYRYSVTNGKLSEDASAEFLLTMEQSISLAGAALELLPLQSSGEILKNIIYLGLPTVLKAVLQGTFHAGTRLS